MKRSVFLRGILDPNHPIWPVRGLAQGGEVATEIDEDIGNLMLLRQGNQLIHRVFFSEATNLQRHSFLWQKNTSLPPFDQRP